MQFTLLEIDDMHKGLWLKKKDHELNLLKLLNVKKKKKSLIFRLHFSFTVTSRA